MTTITQHFDHIAHQYDGFKSKYNFYYNTLKSAIKSLIKNPNTKSIIDIGCGTGTILDYVQPLNGVGIDISQRMIKIAKNKYLSNRVLKFHTHDIEKSPFSGKYDYILLNDVIEHLQDVNTTIKNISMMMTSKTEFILSMANPYWEPILLILEKVHLKMPEGQHFRISEDNLMQILSNHKLQVTKKLSFLPTTKYKWGNKLGLLFVYVIKKTRTR